MSGNFLFLGIKVYFDIAGLEKFNQLFIRSILDNFNDNKVFVNVLHDKLNDSIKPKSKRFHYSYFGSNKSFFLLSALYKAVVSKTIFVAHINIAPIACLLQLIFPTKNIVVIVHGLEVFLPLNFFKRRLLKISHRIITVSSFTKNVLIEKHSVEPAKIDILHNAIARDFQCIQTFNKNEEIYNRLPELKNKFVLVSVCRMKSTEAYKGYDNVIKALPNLLQTIPNVHYLIIGKWDEKEKQRIDKLIEENNLPERVSFSGFVKQEEMIRFIQIADLFIMPSKFEGFGIVFIEAMACGLPVVAGNVDGSRDALLNGQLGRLINPESVLEIVETVNDIYLNYNSIDKGQIMHDRVVDVFSEKHFQAKQFEILSSL